MTDEQIAKGIECCSEFLCGECPYEKFYSKDYQLRCSAKLMNDIKELFNRKNPEIQKLKNIK